MKLGKRSAAGAHSRLPFFQGFPLLEAHTLCVGAVWASEALLAIW